MLNIAILGYGTVGSGVYEVIRTNSAIVNSKSGNDIHVKYVLDLRDFPGDPVEKVLVHDFDTIINDPEVKIVVEVMGGLNPAYKFVKQSLEAGKSVCTSNKELVAKYGPELISIAKAHSVSFLFEASVGGGIPILRPLQTSLTADKISKISGILNGTTNFILSKMGNEGWEFEEALKKAQEMGYAERNSEADVEGYDACRKIAILASLTYGYHVDFEDIYTEGITRITARDILYAKQMNRAVKLLATCRQDDDRYFAMVAPFLVADGNPLYNVGDVFNGILVTGNMLGDVMFYGSGAGKRPTASAVVSDVVDAAANLGKHISIDWKADKLPLEAADTVKFRYFIRLSGTPADKQAAAESAFGPITLVTLPNETEEFGFVTEAMSESEYAAKAAKVDGILNRIRLD